MNYPSKMLIHGVFFRSRTDIPSLLKCCRLYSSRPTLHASPESGLADEALDIRVSGLSPGQSVSLQGEVDTECGRYRFKSRANYTANENGNVEVGSQPSLGGTYTGVEPMGLLWSALPREKDLRKYPRLMKLDATKPWSYTLSLIDGVCEHDSDDSEHRLLDSMEIERHYLPPYVDRIPVKRGPLKGTLFIPQQKVSSSGLPVIIDMPGGGLSPPNGRTSLLASHGFAVFGFDYISPLLEELKSNGKVTYFDSKFVYDIIDLIKEHPSLDEDRIAINGSCFGGNMALQAVSRIPNLPIRCISVQRCEDFLEFSTGFRMLDGSTIEPAETRSLFDFHKEADGTTWCQRKFDHHYDDIENEASYVAPAENISVPTSLLICGDDQITPADKVLIRVASRMMRAGKNHLVDVTYLEGAGHLLETPYIPLCKQSVVYLPRLIEGDVALTNWGGQTTAHQRAQVTTWKKTINFFRRHLGPMEMCRHDWVDDNDQSKASHFHINN